MIKQVLVFKIIIVFLLSSLSFPQSDELASPYFDQPHYLPFLNYAINSGYITLPHVLNQPFTCSELYYSFVQSDGLGNQIYIARWKDILLNDLARFFSPQKLNDKYGNWHLGMNGYYRLMADSNKKWTQYRAEIYGIYSLPYLVLMNKTVTDRAFKTDPTYYGDTGEWIYGRSENAYVLLQYKSLQLFGGRVSRNFGIMNEPSVIFSSNPYSYDHYGFQLTTKHLRYSFYTSRLNDIVGFDSQAVDDTPHPTKRYYSIQRAELALLKNFRLGLSEVVIYGGQNQTVESIYLNPLNLYYIAQRNQRVQMNGLWAFEFYWKPSKILTLYNQLLIDDIIVNNEPGQDDRTVHPDRLGIASKIILTNYLLPGTQFSLMYNRVGNWTYMSYRTWENYVYHGLSMGYPENSVEAIRLDIDYFGKPPFIFQLQAGYKRCGEQNINDVFGDTKEKFPIGTVEEIRFAGLSLSYMPSFRFNAKFNVNCDLVDNENNVPSGSKSNFSISLILYSTLNLNFMY